MTKDRAPVTIENTLRTVLGTLGIEQAADVTGRQQAYLHALTDPARNRLLTVPDLIKLDTAHLEHDGTTPLLDCLVLTMKAMRVAHFPDAAAIRDATADILREDGEAHVALFAACQPDASDRMLVEALAEVEQAHAAKERAIVALHTAIAHRATGPPT